MQRPESTIPGSNREPWTPRQDRIAATLVAVGVALRVARWLADPAPYGDEAAISLNVIDRSFADLAGRLDWNCGAPIGWLWLEKCAVLAFGTGERALRIVPLLSGCAAVALLRPLVRSVLAPTAGLVALGLFAVSWRMTDYSAVAKPYATDVLAAVALPLLAARFLDAPSRGRRTALALAGCAALAASIASVFVLGGVAAALTLAARRSRRGGSATLGVVALWTACLAALWFAHLRPLAENAYLQGVWAQRFAPVPPTSLADLAWYPVNFVRVFGLLFAPPLDPVLGGAALAAASLGAWRLARHDAPSCATLALPILLVLAASAARVYPFAHRLVFFLVPAIAVLSAEGFGAVARRLPARGGTVALSLLVAAPLAQAAYTTAVQPEKQDVRSVAALLAENARPGDVVYLRYEARAQFEWARRRMASDSLSGLRIIGGANPREAPRDAAVEMDELPAGPRVWVVFSFPGREERDDERASLARLEARGRVLDTCEADGARAHLFELR